MCAIERVVDDHVADHDPPAAHVADGELTVEAVFAADAWARERAGELVATVRGGAR